MVMQYLPGSLEIENVPYDREVWNSLTNLLENLDGYCAYKIPVLGASNVAEIPTFIVVTLQYGILLLDVVPDEIVATDPDGRFWTTSNGDIYSRDVILEQYCDEMESRFKKTATLYRRKAREALVPIKSILLFRENDDDSLDRLGISEFSFAATIDYNYFSEKITHKYFSEEWGGTDIQFGDILSLIEGTWRYKTNGKKFGQSADPSTINDFVSLSLDRTFKQDNAQRQVSMQIPSGPQRIRGLAGTGKTVVLSLKAALTALRLPEFKILFLFNTQSLYDIIEKQIGDYYAKEAKTSLPAGRIDILHAWGGKTTGVGLYSKLCGEYGVSPLTLRDIGRSGDALQKIYKKLNESVGNRFRQEYDLVLVDEAQDFPNEVFEVVFQITKDPKRIVVAYDDFQSLKGLKIREFDELFGKDIESGKPRFESGSLAGEYAGGVAKDFVLPNCYRNPRNILMVAHGVALGVARKEGVVDSVDKVEDWKALGYQVNSPQHAEIIKAGDFVEVERLDIHSTNLLEKILNENQKNITKLIQTNVCSDKQVEIKYIVNKIDDLITNQGVSAHEIFVIAIDTRGSETFLSSVRSLLNSVGIRSIMPGFVESSRHFYEENCVVLTTAYRAKGNEANIIFVSNCEGVVSDVSFNKRNSFFVSVTRSRGWCYISGIGGEMKKLCDEIDTIQSTVPKLSYFRPTDRDIARRRLILSSDDSKNERAQKDLSKIAAENPELFHEFIRSRMNSDDD